MLDIQKTNLRCVPQIHGGPILKTSLANRQSPSAEYPQANVKTSFTTPQTMDKITSQFQQADAKSEIGQQTYQIWGDYR